MDGLTDEQRGVLRLALVELERELAGGHEAAAEAAAPVQLDEPIGRLSRMDAMQQQSMVQANRAALQRRLEQVRAALRRCDAEADDYGVCVTCGESVGFRRLSAQPEALFCVACQGARERRG